MDELITKKRITRFFENGKVMELEDHIIREYRLLIHLDGEEFIQAVVLPSLLEEFVLGFLVTRGIIHGPEDLTSLEVEKGTASVLRHPENRGMLPDLRLLESTGSRNLALEIAPHFASTLSSSPLRVSAKVLIKGVRMLSQMPLYKKTGGTHCATLFDSDGEPVMSAEDVGRHNSVDKAIGGGLKKGADFARCWLAVSGRLPADMVLKPLMVGIPLVASVSAATFDAIEIGEGAGLTVIGFSREGRMNCYCHPERIIPAPS